MKKSQRSISFLLLLVISLFNFNAFGSEKPADMREFLSSLKDKRASFQLNPRWEKPYESLGVYLEQISRFAEKEGGSESLVEAVDEFKDLINLAAMKRKKWSRPISFLLNDLSPASQFKKNPSKLKEVWLRNTWAHPPTLDLSEILDQLPVSPVPINLEEKIPALKELPVQEVSSDEESIGPVESPRGSFVEKIKNSLQNSKEKRRIKKDAERKRKVLSRWRVAIIEVAKQTQNEEAWIRDYYEGRKKKYIYIRSDCAQRIAKLKQIQDKIEKEAEKSPNPEEVLKHSPRLSVRPQLTLDPVAPYIQRRDLLLNQLEMMLYLEIIIREVGFQEIDATTERLHLEKVDKLLKHRDMPGIITLVKDFLVA